MAEALQTIAPMVEKERNRARPNREKLSIHFYGFSTNPTAGGQARWYREEGKKERKKRGAYLVLRWSLWLQSPMGMGLRRSINWRRKREEEERRRPVFVTESFEGGRRVL